MVYNLPMQKRTQTIMMFAGIGLILLMLASLIFMPGVLANEQEAATNMVNGILKVVYTIVRIVGILLAIVGIVKFVMAHANEQGPEQQKAAVMLAVGVVLVLLPTILDAINFTSLIHIYQ